MKNLIKRLLREGLQEAIKDQPHWDERYYQRITTSTLKDLDPKHKEIIDKGYDFIESIEFDPTDSDRLGIWVHKTPVMVRHYPWKERDKGKYVLVVVKENLMKTFYWKHELEGEVEVFINIRDLVDMVNSDHYDPETKPISTKSVIKYFNIKKNPQKVNPNEMKFKAHKDLINSKGNHTTYVANKENLTVRTLSNDKKTGKPVVYDVDDVLEMLPDNVLEFLFN